MALKKWLRERKARKIVKPENEVTTDELLEQLATDGYLKDIVIATDGKMYRQKEKP